MTLRPDLMVGTLTTTSGQKPFTVEGTALKTYGVRPGDTFIVNGLMLVIDEVLTETTGTFVANCPAGAAVTDYPVLLRYHQDGSSLSAKTRELLEILGGGVFFQYRASGTTLEKGLYDTQPKGFTYLATDTDPMGLWIKASNTIGDWAGPTAYLHGNDGWAPNIRMVTDGGRLVLELFEWTGGTGVAPTTVGYFGPSGLTPNIAAATDIRPPAGPGTGDMLRSVFDPQNILDDAFDLANQTGLLPAAQVSGLSPVATSGSFSDLLNTPRFDFSVFIAGKTLPEELVARYSFLETVIFPEAATGSRASAATASTGARVFHLLKNGTEFGTVTFTASSTGVIDLFAQTTFVPNDVLTIIGPTIPDGDLADITIALAGNY